MTGFAFAQGPGKKGKRAFAPRGERAWLSAPPSLALR